MLLSTATILLVCATTEPAGATFPGQNGTLAYRHVGEAGNLRTITPDGTVGGGLTTPSDGAYEPAYSPDGRRIAYVGGEGPSSGGDLWIMNADGTDKRGPLATPEQSYHDAQTSGPSWSPEGDRIAFVRYANYSSSLVVFDLTTGAQRTLISSSQPPALSSISDPAWSPDGSTLAFAAFGGEARFERLWTIPAAGGAPVPLTGADGQASSFGADDPDWSPDGRRLVFAGQVVVDEGARPRRQLFVIPAGGGTPRPIPNAGGVDPVWSPDGARVAFVEAGMQQLSGPLVSVDPDGAADQKPDVILRGFAAEVTWQPLDTVPPRVAVVSPVEDRRYLRGADVPAIYTCQDPLPGWGVTVECSGPVPSGTPITTSTPGQHAVTFRGRDRMGNETVVTRRYTVVAPPAIRIVAGPDGEVARADARFTFAADRHQVSFSCRLDGGPWRACSGGGSHSVSRLAPGAHTLRVRGVDADGFASDTVLREWTVLPRPSPPATNIRAGWRRIVPGNLVEIRSLQARRLLPRTTLTLRCTGPGCPRDLPIRRQHARARRVVPLTRWLAGHRLRPWAMVQVELRTPGYAGLGKRYCVRRGRRPAIVEYRLDRPRPSCNPSRRR